MVTSMINSPRMLLLGFWSALNMGLSENLGSKSSKKKHIPATGLSSFSPHFSHVSTGLSSYSQNLPIIFPYVFPLKNHPSGRRNTQITDLRPRPSSACSMKTMPQRDTVAGDAKVKSSGFGWMDGEQCLSQNGWTRDFAICFFGMVQLIWYT